MNGRFELQVHSEVPFDLHNPGDVQYEITFFDKQDGVVFRMTRCQLEALLEEYCEAFGCLLV